MVKDQNENWLTKSTLRLTIIVNHRCDEAQIKGNLY